MDAEETFEPDMQVAYVPYHAKGNIRHPDVEFGKVSSVRGDIVFVKFGNVCTAQGCKREQLRRVKLGDIGVK